MIIRSSAVENINKPRLIVVPICDSTLRSVGQGLWRKSDAHSPPLCTYNGTVWP